MFINDIEFIDPLSQKDIVSNSAIVGGASAHASTSVGTDDGVVHATAYVEATGDYSRGISKTRIKLRVRKNRRGKSGRVIGYTYAFGDAFGKDLHGAPVGERSRSFSRL